MRRLSLSYLENLSQNETTSKSTEVYILRTICSSKGLFIKRDPQVQPQPEKESKLRWQYSGLLQLSLKERSFPWFQYHIPSWRTCAQGEEWTKELFLYFFFLFLQHSLLLGKLTRLWLFLKVTKEYNWSNALYQWICCFFLQSGYAGLTSSLAKPQWVNTALNSSLRKLLSCKSQVRGYMEPGIICVLTSQDTFCSFLYASVWTYLPSILCWIKNDKILTHICPSL